MAADNSKLNLPKRDVTAPTGDFALPKSETTQPAASTQIPPAGAMMNLSAPHGEVRAADSAAATAANDFTFTVSGGPACPDETLAAVRKEAEAADPSAKLHLPPRGLTY